MLTASLRSHMNTNVDKAGDSLSIRIDPRVNWLGVMTAFLLMLILSGVGLMPALNGLKHAVNTGGTLGGYILGIAVSSFLILLVLYSAVLDLLGSETVTLNATDLQIQHSMLGFVMSQREFPNSTVEMLRCERGLDREERGCRTVFASIAWERRSRSRKIFQRRSRTSSSTKCERYTHSPSPTHPRRNLLLLS